MDVYGECLIRTATTNGILMLTFTPLAGLTETVLQFLPDMWMGDSLGGQLRPCELACGGLCPIGADVRQPGDLSAATQSAGAAVSLQTVGGDMFGHDQKDFCTS